MKKYLAMLLAGAMCVSLMAGCGGGDKSASTGTASSNTASSGASADGSAETGVLKIGGIGPLTGGAAVYGIATKQGAEIAVQEINAKGGLQLSLDFQDDEADPEKGVNAYNKLKGDGMQVVYGCTTTGSCLAVAAETFNDRIFQLTPSASSADVTAGKDNVFQICFTDPGQGAKSAEYIATKGLASKVAIIWKNDDVYSKGIHDTFVEEAAARNLAIVSDTTFADGNDTDFSVQLNNAKDAGADLVFLPMYYQPASLIFAQAKAMGYAPTWFGVDGMDGILTMDGFDTSLAEGVILLTPFSADASDEKTQNFVKKYQDQFGETPNQFAADAYDCVYAIKQALENAGCTPDMSNADLCAAMLEQFTTMTFEGLTGDGAGITWTADGAVSKSPKGMVIQDGAYVGLD